MRFVIQTILPLLVVVLLQGACQPEDPDPCIQETITDPNYFATERTLSNTCVKGAGTDYYLAGNQTYRISAALTIEPGTRIVVGDSAGLIVEATGSLFAVGRVDAPVELTSESGEPGAWRGVLLQSNASNNRLKHVHIEYAGGPALDTTLPAAALGLADGSGIELTYCDFGYSQGYGLALQSNQAELRSLEENLFSNNAAVLRVPAEQTHRVSNTNAFSANAENYLEVVVGDEITTSVSWPTQTIPYRLVEGAFGRTIQAIGGSSQFSIREGNEVQFSDDTGFLIEDDATFVAIGSENNPLLFTGVRKAPGSWNGFRFRNTQQSNTIRFARIEHAGGSGAAIYMWSNPRLDLADIDFTYCPTCALADGPKLATQPANPNLSTVRLTYTHVYAQYCKQQ